MSGIQDFAHGTWWAGRFRCSNIAKVLEDMSIVTNVMKAKVFSKIDQYQSPVQSFTSATIFSVK